MKITHIKIKVEKYEDREISHFNAMLLYVGTYCMWGSSTAGE